MFRRKYRFVQPNTTASSRNSGIYHVGALFLRQEARDNSHSSQGFQVRSQSKFLQHPGIWSFSGEESSATLEYQSMTWVILCKRKRTSNHSCGKRRLPEVTLHLFCPLPFQASVLSERSHRFSSTDINSRSPVEIVSAPVFLVDILGGESFHPSIEHVHQLSVLDQRPKRFLLDSQYTYEYAARSTGIYQNEPAESGVSTRTGEGILSKV